MKEMALEIGIECIEGASAGSECVKRGGSDIPLPSSGQALGGRCSGLMTRTHRARRWQGLLNSGGAYTATAPSSKACSTLRGCHSNVARFIHACWLSSASSVKAMELNAAAACCATEAPRASFLSARGGGRAAS